MRLSTAKDKLLKHLVESPKDILHGIDPDLYAAALKSLSDEGYINIIGTSVLGSGHTLTYKFQSLNPSAAIFAKRHSFRTISWQDYAIKGIKNFWVIFAFVITTSITFYQLYKSNSQQTNLQKQVDSIQKELGNLKTMEAQDTLRSIISLPKK